MFQEHCFRDSVLLCYYATSCSIASLASVGVFGLANLTPDGWDLCRSSR